MSMLRYIRSLTLQIVAISGMIAYVSCHAAGAELPVIRLGLLQFGTVGWEVSVIQDGLDRQHGFRLSPVSFADKDAAAIALLAGDVDVIVTDWLWVARQRAAGKDFTFVPFSTAVGGVMARPEAGVRSVADLVGRKIGIGGGPDDKSWLLLRAYAQKVAGIDLVRQADIQFAAPPILNELADRGRLDAVLNFWQFNAQLQAKGFQEVISIKDMLGALGIDRPPPLLGWVFHEKWANSERTIVQALFDASFDAKQQMLTQDAVWARIRPQMKASDDAVFLALRASYRAGIPAGYGQADIDAAKAAFHAMSQVDRAAMGGIGDLPDGTFWSGYRR